MKKDVVTCNNKRFPLQPLTLLLIVSIKAAIFLWLIFTWWFRTSDMRFHTQKLPQWVLISVWEMVKLGICNAQHVTWGSEEAFLLPDVALCNLTPDRDVKAAPHRWKGLSNCRCSPGEHPNIRKGKEGGSGKLPASQPHLSPCGSSGVTHPRSHLPRGRFCTAPVLSVLVLRDFYAVCTKRDIRSQGYPV